MAEQGKELGAPARDMPTYLAEADGGHHPDNGGSKENSLRECTPGLQGDLGGWRASVELNVPRDRPSPIFPKSSARVDRAPTRADTGDFSRLRETCPNRGGRSIPPLSVLTLCATRVRSYYNPGNAPFCPISREHQPELVDLSPNSTRRRAVIVQWHQTFAEIAYSVSMPPTVQPRLTIRANLAAHLK